MEVMKEKQDYATKGEQRETRKEGDANKDPRNMSASRKETGDPQQMR